MENFSKPEIFKERGPLEQVRKFCDSKEEAILLVREFWQAMPHGSNLTVQNNDYTQELTMGDRTKILEGKLRGEKGKWVVVFRGNNQPLSNEAVDWLKNLGLVA